LLTDPGSVNGCFVNDIKVSSTLLSDGDVLVIGGLGQKIPIGTCFPQPNAEFIFQFCLSQQQPLQAAAARVIVGTQEATLQLPPVVSESADDAVSAASHSVAGSEAEDEQKQPPAPAPVHARAAEDDDDDDGPTQLLPPQASAAEDAATQLLPPAADVEPEEAPTQLLPPEPVLPVVRRPSLRKKSSNDMTDTFAAAGQVVYTTAAPAMPAPHPTAAAAIQIRITHPPAAAVVAAAAAAAPRGGGLDIHAYRVAASIDASMAEEHAPATLLASQSGDDCPSAAAAARPGLGVRPMSIDHIIAASRGDEATQLLPSSQAATQVIPPVSSAAAGSGLPGLAATISPSLLGCLDGLGVATQTQVIPQHDDDHAAPSSSAATSNKASVRSDLYDDDEDDAVDPRAPASAKASAAAAAGVSSPAAFASPMAASATAAVASSPKVATPASSSKKRGRDPAQEEEADDGVEIIPSDDEEVQSAKRRKLARKGSGGAAVAAAARSSSAGKCPVCSKDCAAAELESHVEACLVAAAADEADAAARRLAAEFDAADAAAERERAMAGGAGRASAGGGRGKYKSPGASRRAGTYTAVVAAAAAARRAAYDDSGDYDDDDDGEDDEDDEDGGEDAPAAPFSFFGGFASAAPVPPARKPAAAAAAAASGPKSSCPLCDKLFLTSELPEHAEECEGADELCPKCEQGFLPSLLPTHRRVCKGPPILCSICERPFAPDVVEAHQMRCVGVDGKECRVCQQLVPGCEFDAHVKRCLQREMDLSQDEKLAMGFQRGEQRRDLVNDMQTRAIQWVEKQARALSCWNDSRPWASRKSNSRKPYATFVTMRL
jgi:hypothetical protein